MKARTAWSQGPGHKFLLQVIFDACWNRLHDKFGDSWQSPKEVVRIKHVLLAVPRILSTHPNAARCGSTEHLEVAREPTRPSSWYASLAA